VAEPVSTRIAFRQILPNLVTIISICAGVTGIRFAFEGRFELAVGLVLGAAFLDGIDGRIARLVNGQSRFGAEMDSLADIVNFGVAPALLLYAYTLHDVSSLGWIAALLYISGCALRLARFNTMLDVPDRPAWHSQFFTGVPSPAGAALALFPMYLGFASNLAFPDVTPAVAALYLVAVGILMSSRIPTFSGKSIGIPVRRDHAVGVIFGVVLYIGLLLSFFWETLTVSALAYYVAIPFSVRAYRKLSGTRLAA